MDRPSQSDQSAIDSERLRLVVESVTDYAIVVLDPQGRVLTWNPGAAQITGYPAKEIIGRNVSVLYPPEAVEAGVPRQALEQAMRHGRVEQEGWRLRRDGGRFWANAIVNALHDQAGEFVGYGEIIRDLTERRRQEETVRESEERFRLLVDGVEDYAIFMLDPVGNIVSWNRGAQTMKGYSASEIIGRHFSVFYPEEAIGRNWPENELQIAREQGRFEEEGWRVRKDGSTFWANVVITALRDSTGMLRGFAKVTRDLTARRHYEELQRSERQMNGFLAMLAHELRNPLDPIRHGLDLMRLQPDDPKARQWTLDVIDRQVGQLSRLVDDLLDVSRITMGKIALKLEHVTLQHVVASVAESVRPLADARQQTLAVHFAEAPVQCRADATRVAQIVLNVLTNAVKYTPPGGHITVVVTREGKFGEVKVTDTGMGMSATLVGRVFEPFVQGERTLERAEGGLGLGLTLVRRLAEMHGGSVSAESPGEGKGSTFTVRLPISVGDTSSVKAAGPAKASPPMARQRRVLIVDDNRDAADTLSALVAAWGHRVWTANDGQAALAAASEHKPDMVLLDIGLPGMNGYEVVKAMRRIPGLQRSTIIACTGYGHEGDRQEVRRAGFDHHLVKPVEVTRLQQLLDGLPAARAEREESTHPNT